MTQQEWKNKLYFGDNLTVSAERQNEKVIGPERSSRSERGIAETIPSHAGTDYDMKDSVSSGVSIEKVRIRNRRLCGGTHVHELCEPSHCRSVV